MVGWHHRLNGPEFEQTPGDREGQGSLAHCSPWGRKESDTTQRLNNDNSKKTTDSIVLNSDQNRPFLKENIHMANNQQEKERFDIIEEIQTQTVIKYHLISDRTV